MFFFSSSLFYFSRRVGFLLFFVPYLEERILPDDKNRPPLVFFFFFLFSVFALRNSVHTLCVNLCVCVHFFFLFPSKMSLTVIGRYSLY